MMDLYNMKCLSFGYYGLLVIAYIVITTFAFSAIPKKHADTASFVLSVGGLCMFIYFIAGFFVTCDNIR